jgi:hypothetical protein
LTTVRSVGSALPADVLAATVGDVGLPGLRADDYRLELGVSPREAANRAWSVLSGAWSGYRAALDKLPEGDRAVGLTREKWLAIVLRELEFGSRVPLSPAGGLVADDRSFPVSHRYETDAGHVPLHLLGWGVPLDKRTPGQPGAADRAPHAMLQEYLNRTDQALWGMVSNGRTLRLLRDSSSLVGQSYVEFDLEAMFDGEVFSDFVVLFLVCHATRFETHQPGEVSSEDVTPADCWLERWRTFAVETGTRALAGLSPGVKQAIEVLGTGLMRHPGNDLHARVDSGELSPVDVHHALLRLVYRLLFCFVAEDRGLLHADDADVLAKERYAKWFSTARLRRVSTKRRGSGHGDLWHALHLVLDGLGREDGRPELGLPGLGGLFDLGVSDVVAGCELANEPLLTAVRHLTVVQPAGGGPKRMVDYRNLGAEELGSVYESLLEFVPRYDPTSKSFTLESVVGNERKTTGAYYTPSSLIDCLLDSALDPLLDVAESAADPEAALLALTVCDPACGSGHFLVAAAKRIAARLATVRARAEGADEPTVIDAQTAMHDVVDRCIYGVDLNPMAAELAKVSLWLESVQPGRALSFLDAHIKVGNALLGTTPALLAAGIPDEAFTKLDGDDPKWVTQLKKRNKGERDRGENDLFSVGTLDFSNAPIRERMQALDQLKRTDLRDVHVAAQRFQEFDRSPELQTARLIADAWCSAFVAVKQPELPAITQATQQALSSGASGSPEAELVRATRDEYKFFHWHLEFPQIFQASNGAEGADGPGWAGGFSCVLGNPPWERIKLQEQEFFAAADPEIAGAANAAARKQLIKSLPDRSPRLHESYIAAKRRADGESQFLRLSGRYPLCGRGDINTYAVFAEHDRTIIGSIGRMGVIVPTGIATDATTQHYFKDLVDTSSLVSLLSFENESLVFPGVHHAFKFCLLAVAGRQAPVEVAEFAFYLRRPTDLVRDAVRFELTPDELRLLNPNTGTCPVFRSRRDAEITLGIYRRHPVLINENLGEAGNPWGLSFMTMFHMSNDSGLFRTRDQLEAEGWQLNGNKFDMGDEKMLPLYVGLMASFYDHRASDVLRDEERAFRQNQPRYLSDEEKADPTRLALPAYWVRERDIVDRISSSWDRGWLIGFCDVTSAVNARTVVPAAVPLTAVGHSLPLALPREGRPELLLAQWSSIAFDFVARQKVGGNHLTFFIVAQLATVSPEKFGQPAPWSVVEELGMWIGARVAELAYTAVDLGLFGCDLGFAGPPFLWDPARRLQLRAELDAAFFHLFGLGRTETEYVLSTFPIPNRHDPNLTKRILCEYDAMQQAIDTGIPYESKLTPPPGQGARHGS